MTHFIQIKKLNYSPAVTRKTGLTLQQMCCGCLATAGFLFHLIFKNMPNNHLTSKYALEKTTARERFLNLIADMENELRNFHKKLEEFSCQITNFEQTRKNIYNNLASQTEIF